MNRLSIGIVGLALCACATEPSNYDLPEPDLSLDPQALVEPTVLFMCGRWVDGVAPLDEAIFVDVSFIRRTLDEPYERPTKEDIASVERHGGEIVYKFHVRAVRAFIPTVSIPELEKERGVNLIFRVTNLRRYDWRMGVGYVKPYSYEDGALRFSELGGRVEYRFSSINAIGGVLPDRSVTALRADGRVDYVEAQDGFPNCF